MLEHLYHHYRGSSEYSSAASTVMSWSAPRKTTRSGAYDDHSLDEFARASGGYDDETESNHIFVIGAGEHHGMFGRSASTVDASLLHVFPPTGGDDSDADEGLSPDSYIMAGDDMTNDITADAADDTYNVADALVDQIADDAEYPDNVALEYDAPDTDGLGIVGAFYEDDNSISSYFD